jgi:hypothetical protein
MGGSLLFPPRSQRPAPRDAEAACRGGSRNKYLIWGPTWGSVPIGKTNSEPTRGRSSGSTPHSVAERSENSFAQSSRIALASLSKFDHAPSNRCDGRIAAVDEPQLAQRLVECGRYGADVGRPEGRRLALQQRPNWHMRAPIPTRRWKRQYALTGAVAVRYPTFMTDY